MTTTPATTQPTRKKTTVAPTKKAAPSVKAAKTIKPPVKATPPASGKAASEMTDKANKKKDKPEKVKVVRDSFTIPKTEYAQIAAMKKRAMNLGLEVKKSELIRAGLALLGSTADAAFRKALGNVPTLKTGRPGKD